MLVLFACLTIRDPSAEPDLLLSTLGLVEERLPLDRFFYADEPLDDEIGASALLVPAAAPERADEPRIPEPQPGSELARVEVAPWDAPPQAPQVRLDALVPGNAGVGVTGALGAIDRITHEILLSLQQRRTLVVWIFDQSGSLQRQRAELLARFDRIYEELGIIEASGNSAFASHKDKPLLSAVMAFGERYSYRTAKPTDDLQEIKAAVASVETDASGREFVFAAVHDAARKFHTHRVSEPRRNVMLIVFTDEAGDDIQRLDPAVAVCRKYEMPVYVVGVPAPFGREESMVKYVDPDPNYDQSPQEAPVHQGPESVMAEHLRLHFSGSGNRDEPIDSGFGPYGLTRLCVETGGIYFAVHPNREAGRTITREETAVLAPYLARFFDPAIMRAYRPDYGSPGEYRTRLERNKACAALVEAASLSWVTPMESIPRTFPKRNEAELASLLSQAQQAAAKLEPKIRQLYEILRLGAADRPKIPALRWQAGFDLAIGRALAVKVRTESYNAMLAQAKRGMEFRDPHSDTWVLKPADTISVGSALQKHADEARQYLQCIVREHQGTPWHYLAEKELRQPLGWEWTEAHTGVRQADETPAGDGPRMPRDDQILRLEKPKPKRPPPAL
jgi:hypothetical protein